MLRRSTLVIIAAALIVLVLAGLGVNAVRNWHPKGLNSNQATETVDPTEDVPLLATEAVTPTPVVEQIAAGVAADRRFVLGDRNQPNITWRDDNALGGEWAEEGQVIDVVIWLRSNLVDNTADYHVGVVAGARAVNSETNGKFAIVKDTSARPQTVFTPVHGAPYTQIDDALSAVAIGQEVYVHFRLVVPENVSGFPQGVRLALFDKAGAQASETFTVNVMVAPPKYDQTPVATQVAEPTTTATQ